MPYRSFIIPAEEQSREFDAKLLLACIAAERGFPAIVGARRDIHLKITQLPRGIYYAKSFRSLSDLMFGILRDLGFEIVACDEEALLRYPDHLYFERRVSPIAFPMISNLFAWGPDNEGLFRRCPAYAGAPIHVTGNPRVDLLRPEVRGYFAPEADALRERFGHYFLINTNFGTINHRVPNLSWLNMIDEAEDGGADAEDLQVATTHHRLKLFEHFKKLLPELAHAFPEHSIVLRPHPLENQDPWKEAAAGCENVHVVFEGTVIPWLLAADAVIQNNCTTAVESYLLERPVISFLPIISERLDSPITNAMSHPAHSCEELISILREVAAGERGAREGAEQRALIDHHIAAMDGPLASDRIVDVLESIERSNERPERRGSTHYARAWSHANLRRAEKFVRSQIPNDKNNAAYQEQRFPRLPLAEVRARADRFAELLGRFEKLEVAELHRNIFEVRSV
jgi:surface carbohydrate biosynthesis protein